MLTPPHAITPKSPAKRPTRPACLSSRRDSRPGHYRKVSSAKATLPSCGHPPTASAVLMPTAGSIDKSETPQPVVGRDQPLSDSVSPRKP
ncbi:hypothetical protein B0T18DRAFT_404602 [Schizothecium vesticola]|uniref:Uncharacterized protein n=1 Tax=Schizothecium vesticola TaxID=314040 RepID=A0AA40F708_9PEZI|nr:hypothetical protein B0T18DRAFT_404602 [Schizothecium vesticola]